MYWDMVTYWYLYLTCRIMLDKIQSQANVQQFPRHQKTVSFPIFATRILRAFFLIVPTLRCINNNPAEGKQREPKGARREPKGMLIATQSSSTVREKGDLKWFRFSVAGCYQIRYISSVTHRVPIKSSASLPPLSAVTDQSSKRVGHGRGSSRRWNKNAVSLPGIKQGQRRQKALWTDAEKKGEGDGKGDLTVVDRFLWNGDFSAGAQSVGEEA